LGRGALLAELKHWHLQTDEGKAEKETNKKGKEIASQTNKELPRL
jgi:hypothetical protein